MLLLTTRFSTVLQYSTRDTAEAFERIGWDARVVIEPSPSHRLYQHGIRQAVDEFQPDLVFQIDHLRYEHGDLFPPGVPFACWVQDHLPNLQIPGAGQAVGMRDFVLTDMGPDIYGAARIPAGADRRPDETDPVPRSSAAGRKPHPLTRYYERRERIKRLPASSERVRRLPATAGVRVLRTDKWLKL